MKKRKLFVLLPLLGMTLSGCTFQEGWSWVNEHIFSPIGNFFAGLFGGGNEEEEVVYSIIPKIDGGSKAEQDAILDAVNYKPICYPSGNPSTTIYPDSSYVLKEDSGDNIVLTTKQNVGDKTVIVDWAIDASQDYFSKRTSVDDHHDFVEVKYQGYGVDDGLLKWNIKKISCGGAVSTDSKTLTYSAKCRNFTYRHDTVTIADLNKVTDQEKVVKIGDDGALYKFRSTSDVIDYEPKANQKYSPYFPGNNEGAEEDFMYVGVKGKVLYYAPDGNWGLIGDGDQVLEIYAGAGTKILPENFPNLNNQYVCVYGNMSQYCGNIQLGFISKIVAIDKSEITEPTKTYAQLTESTINGFVNPTSEGYDSHKQFIDGFSNSLATVTGTFVAGSLKDRDGKTVAVDKLVDNRFTFDLKVGTATITVAYDYHINIGAKTNLFTEFKNKIKNGGSLTVKGTMRYSGSDSSSFLSLAYEPTDIDDATAFNKLVDDGAYVCTRNGDTFTKASSYNSSKSYYVRVDKNAGARWNICPMVSGDIA